MLDVRAILPRPLRLLYGSRASHLGGLVKMRYVVAVLGALLLCVSSPAQAHHSLSAYNANIVLTVTGTVAQYEWQNPHIRIQIWLADTGGDEVLFIFEGSDVGRAARFGWSAEAFRSGDSISVAYNPFSNGDGGGHLVEVTTSEGEIYSFLRFPDRSDAVQSGSDAAP